MDKMTFEQFLKVYGLEEDFQYCGMIPEEYLKSVFEEEPVKAYKCKGRDRGQIWIK